MREYLEANLKDLMNRHPGLAPVLEGAGIGCTTCSLATCRVKDILEIHALDTAQTRELLQAMGEVVFGGAPFEVPHLERRPAPPRPGFCPPIARMVEEHAVILRVLDRLPALASAFREARGEAGPWVARTLDFVRGYADRYHHAKEEDQLFRFFDPEADILRVMCEDHAEGRAHVQAATEALATGDAEALAGALGRYAELLRGHIHREDTILYPWMDRSLSDRQVGQLFAACQGVEAHLGAEAARHEAFVAELEARLGS